MINIVLLCTAGMSTSLLVKKMRDAAEAEGFECVINAFPMNESAVKCADADVILLGPQVRFNLNKIKEQWPDKPVDAIDMADYGMMNGKKVLSSVRILLGEKLD